MEEQYKLKMAVISGASTALKLKAENPKTTDEEIMQQLTDQTKQILSEIDEEEF